MTPVLSLLAALTFTAPSPMLVRDLAPAPGASSLRTRADHPTLEWDPWVGVLPNGVVFEAVGEDGATGLWISDGTSEGTRALAAVDSLDARVAGSELFFRVRPDGRANGLWHSAGTAASTGPVTVPSVPDTFVEPFAALGGRLLFGNSYGGAGRTLWITDGSDAGTQSLVGEGQAYTTPKDVVVLGERAVFTATGSAGRELWATDGTPAGTAMIADITPGTDGTFVLGGAQLTRFGAHVLFPANGSLWRSDGTASGTEPIAAIGANRFFAAFATGDRLFFVPVRAHFPLWVTDGTADGTSVVGGGINVRGSLGAVGGRALFFGSDRRGDALWSSDGTFAGTVRLRPLHVDSSVFSSACVAAACVFAADDGVHGLEPWRSDGTVEGTAPIADLLPGDGSSRPYGFAAASGRIVFLADDGVHGFEPWLTDGRAGHVRLIADLRPGPASSAQGSLDEAQPLLAFADRILLGADDGVHGRELWAIPLAALAVDGDCDDDGTVSIADLVRAVSIALGAAPLATCPSADVSGDGTVAIEELISLLAAAL